MCPSEAEVNRRELMPVLQQLIGKAGDLKYECAFMEHPDKKGKQKLTNSCVDIDVHSFQVHDKSMLVGTYCIW